MSIWRYVVFGSLVFVALVPSDELRANPFEATNRSVPRREDDSVDLEALLARFEDEPSVREVQRAALRHGSLDDMSLQKGRARARWSNLIPIVDGEVAWLGQRDTEFDFQEDLATTEEGRLRHDDARNEYGDDERRRRSYSLELEFDLRGLLFDDAELDVMRESRERLEARGERVVTVTKLYFERRKRQVERILTPRSKWRKQLDLVLAIRRYTARLDALTGGWFSEQLK